MKFSILIPLLAVVPDAYAKLTGVPLRRASLAEDDVAPPESRRLSMSFIQGNSDFIQGWNGPVSKAGKSTGNDDWWKPATTTEATSAGDWTEWSSKSSKSGTEWGSKSSSSKSGKSESVAECTQDVFVDEVCTAFCNEYFELCATNNIYLNPPETKDKYRRNLVVSAEANLHRANNLPGLTEAIKECQQECMKFPRGQDPATYPVPRGVGRDASAVFDTDGNLIPADEVFNYPNQTVSYETQRANTFNSNLGGDTLSCRKRHLSLTRGSRFDAAFHCPHAGNPSAGICRDSEITIGKGVKPYTPYEHLRDATPTLSHFGYCDVAGDGLIAECTDIGVTDDNIGSVLSLLPATTEILFLNGNPGITTLPAGLFAELTKLKALYLNDCSITNIDQDALADLPDLEIFNIDVNPITSIPESLFAENSKLKQFSAFFLFGLTAIPETLFHTTPELERLVMYANGISKFEPKVFKGLTKLEIISFVDCAFDDDGFPEGVFDDLESLQFFDFFGNKLTKVPASWFGDWSSNVLRLAMWNNEITEIEAGALGPLDSLEQAYFHLNPLSDEEKIKLAEQVKDKENLVQFTV